MKKSSIFLLWWIVLTGCTSLQKKASPDFDRTRMYPNGTYTHQVEIFGGGGHYEFKGIVKISAEKILVVGLSPFQTTVFKLDEDRKTKKIDLQVYEHLLKPHESKILDFYATLGTLLTLGRDGRDPRLSDVKRNERGDLSSMTIGSGEKRVKVEVTRYDDNNIADKFTIDGTKFKVLVRVVAYEI